MRSSLVVLALAGMMLGGACRRGPAPRITLEDVERCERGIDVAASKATLREMMSIYFRECSGTCAEPQCRNAFLEASAAPADRQPMILLERCSKVYCPLFSAQKLPACDPAFVMTPLTAAFGWNSLYAAILQRDASGYTPRLQRAFLALNVAMVERIRSLPTPPGSASASAP